MPTLRLLGSADLRDDGARELRRLLGQPKRLAVMAYLAGNAPQVYHRRDRLLALFWPESTAEQARHGLRQVLYELRNHLGENVILNRGAEEIALNADIVSCDVAQFQSAIQEGDLERATELYRGAFLDGFFLSGTPEFDEWTERRRAELLREVVAASWNLVERREADGDHAGALAVAQRAVELKPADEGGVRRLLGLLDRQGNRGEAVRVYDRLARRLREEFDAEPSPETQALIERIREARAARAPDSGLSIPPPESAGRREPALAESLERWTHPAAAATLFGIASVVILVTVYLVMLQLGLPEWVLRSAVVLLIIGLPIFLATALVEHRRLDGADPRWHGLLTWRRAFQGGGLGFASLAAVTAGFMVSRATGIGPAATLVTSGVLDVRDPILLAEFDNRTSDPMLGETIAGGLRIDLSQSRVVRLVEPATVAAAKQRMLVEADAPLDEALARQIAEREGLKAVLAGDITHVGTGYVLSARLISPVDGALLGAERVSADSDAELIAAIDQLSARLRARIGESLKDVRASPPLSQVTTSSLDALRRFTEAIRLADLEGDWEASGILLEEAVALDTTFAMAYRKLGFTGPPGGSRTDANQAALTRAFGLREHLTASERHAIEADYYSLVDYDEQRSRAAFRSALAIDSNNYVALNNLAARMIHTRQWAERESLATRAIEASAGAWQAYTNVISAQLLQGKADAARATLDRFAQVNPGSPFIVTWQLDALRASRRYDEAEVFLRERLSDPDVAGGIRRDAMEDLGDLLWLRGRVGEAERWYREWMAAGRGADRFLAARHLATLLATFGGSDEAVRLMEGFPVDTGPRLGRPYLALAEFHAAAGRVDQAERLLALHDSVIPAGFLKHPFRQQYVRQVAGEVALGEGRFADAVSEFQAAHELAGACVTCGLARMGYALVEDGRPDSALAVYRRLVSIPTDGTLADADVRWLPDAYRRLGELYEARNDTANAVDAYSEFVELWKNADPELQPQVDDVRQRIANLVAEPGASGRGSARVDVPSR